MKQISNLKSQISNHNGFTLLELLLVMFIIGLSAALSIPTVGSTIDSLRVKSAAKNLSTTLKFARNTAIEERQPYSVEINPWENIISLVPLFKAESKREMKISKEAKIVKITRFSEEKELKEKGIIFYPKGNSSGGSIEIHDAEDRPAYLIKIEPSTGRVRVERM